MPRGLLLFTFLARSLAASAGATTCPRTATGTIAVSVNQAAGAAQFPDGRILVADTYNNRLILLAANGSVLSFHGPGLPAGYGSLNKPAGVAIDALGNVYVADQFGNRIVKFNSTMTLTGAWGSGGSGPGQMQLPSNLAVSPDGSTLYVTELAG